MTSGVLTNPDVKYVGGTLSATVPAGSLVLPVYDAGDFEEEFSTGDFYLTIGEDLTPRRYVAVANDEGSQQSVTLAFPTTVAYEAGLPVIMWDPLSKADDKRAIQYPAEVRLSDRDAEEEPVPVLVRHTLVPLSGVYSLEGAQVTIVEDEDGQWWVDNVGGRTPVVDSGFVATPKALGLLNVDGLWPTGTFGTIKDLGAFDLSTISYNSLTGIWTFSEPGYYLVLLNVTFSANMAGDRIARVRIHYADGSSDVGSVVKSLPVENASALQVNEMRYFFPGQGVSMEARQTSGGNLTLLGSNGNLGGRPTGVSIVRVAM